ncbi:hypothetical protein [Novosphingobium sp.]|uniref:hypothetical protein n=1 Tax=Novosphingobium sp. TaxID=1874826 RepID=UPI0028AB8147|nr:hypothetical protein [Novosphingobium sp.]
MAKSRNKLGADGETAKKALQLSATPELATIITVPQDQAYLPLGSSKDINAFIAACAQVRDWPRQLPINRLAQPDA